MLERTFRFAPLLALSIVCLTACLTPAATTPADNRANWQPIGLSGGGGLAHPAISPHEPGVVLAESDMGGRYLSHDGGRTWSMIHRDQITSAFRTCPPVFHPKKEGVVYALQGHAGGPVHVSRDSGRTWTRLPDDQQPEIDTVKRMYIDPATGRFFLGSLAGKVLFTDDEGSKWTQAQGLPEAQVLRFVAQADSPDDARVYWVGTTEGVYKSADGGKTFTRGSNGLPTDQPVTGFAGGSNAEGTVLYASVPCWLADGELMGGVYVSTDGGQSWKRQMNPKINTQTERSSEWARGDIPQYSHFVANDVDPSVAYVYCAGTSYFPPNHSTVYKTTDAGKSWSEVFFVDPRFKEHNVAHDWMTRYLHQSYVAGPISMEISPTDPNVVMRTDGMFMFTTRDGGKAWDANHTVAAGTVTADPQTWWHCNGLVNTTTWHYYVDPFEPHRHYIAYTDIGFARSLDRGKTWRWWGPGGRPDDLDAVVEDYPVPRDWRNTTYELAFDPQIPGKIWSALSGHHDIPNENSIWRGTGKSRFPGGVCVSKDFGVSWEALRSGLPEKPVLSVVVDPDSPKGNRTLYASVYDHGVYKSTDDGRSWTQASEGLGHPDNMRVCKIQLHPDGRLFVLITGMRVPADGPFTEKGAGLYRSTDGAKTWQLVNKSRPLVYPRDFAVDPADSDVIYVGASDGPNGEPQQGGLWRTRDGGETWELAIRKRGAHFGATFHPKNKGWIYTTTCGWYAAPEGGTLWLSKDDGKTWDSLDGIPFTQLHRIHFDPLDNSVIYVTTFGGSVWKGPAE